MAVKKPVETHFPSCGRGSFRGRKAQALHKAG
jgi:hypothetical protein